MVKLLQLALLCAFSVQTYFAMAASNPNDQQPGSGGEREEEALIEQQIQATTEELRIANYPQIKSLCLVCFVEGLSKNNRNFIAEAKKNRQNPNSAEFAKLSEMVLVSLFIRPISFSFLNYNSLSLSLHLIFFFFLGNHNL